MGARSCAERSVPRRGGSRRGWAAGARPPGTSCQHKMLALQLERPLGKLKTRQQILAFEVWKFAQHVLKRVAGRQVLQNGFHRIPQSTDDRFAMANLGVDGDA